MSSKLTKAKLKKILEHALKLHKSLDTLEFTSWSITVSNIIYDIKNSIELFCNTNKELKCFDDVFASCGYKSFGLRYTKPYEEDEIEDIYVVKFTNKTKTKWVIHLL